MRIINEINVKLSRLISRKGLIGKKELDAYLKDSNKRNVRLDNFLLERSALTEDQALDVCLSFLRYKYINLDKIGRDTDLILKIPESFVDSTGILPIRYDVKDEQKKYTVAIADPFNLNALDMAYALYGTDTTIVYTTRTKLKSIYTIFHSKYNVEKAIQEIASKADVVDENDLKEDVSVSTNPAVVLVENIIKEAIALKASDIHIEPHSQIVRVRNRIDGVLYESSTFDLQTYQTVITRLKIMSGINITEKRIPQDGRFSMNLKEGNYDFRLSTLPTVNGEKIVIRVLDTSAFNFNLYELGFNDRSVEIVRPVLKHPHGIILLTGPTGCGKSTTLYSFIREINSTNTNIVSVEDPVEYTIDGVNQVQVNNKVNMTFARALRSILRQDPNIIMIGEIRDEETAHIAIRAAITGHLVLSTLHTNDAVGAITRLVDMGVEPYLVSDALDMVIAQRLIRKLCPDCKKKVMTTKSQMLTLGLQEPINIYEPCGCVSCHNTGYKGRTGIHEIVVLDETVRNMIVEKATTDQIEQYLRKSGNFIDLRQALIEAIKQGITGYSELFTLTVGEDF